MFETVFSHGDPVPLAEYFRDPCAPYIAPASISAARLSDGDARRAWATIVYLDGARTAYPADEYARAGARLWTSDAGWGPPALVKETLVQGADFHWPAETTILVRDRLRRAAVEALIARSRRALFEADRENVVAALESGFREARFAR